MFKRRFLNASGNISEGRRLRARGPNTLFANTIFKHLFEKAYSNRRAYKPAARRSGREGIRGVRIYWGSQTRKITTGTLPNFRRRRSVGVNWSRRRSCGRSCASRRE